MTTVLVGPLVTYVFVVVIAVVFGIALWLALRPSKCSQLCREMHRHALLGWDEHSRDCPEAPLDDYEERGAGRR